MVLLLVCMGVLISQCLTIYGILFISGYLIGVFYFLHIAIFTHFASLLKENAQK